jgi:Fe2+ or Zn2+ uptake regulation protein
VEAGVTTTNLEREVEKRLAERGVRFTKGRRTLVKKLGSADGPRSAAELHQVIGGELPLSSLYRSLTVLESVGVLVPHFSKKGVTRYELAEWLTGHHHHLVCIECGNVEDVDLPQPYEQKLSDLVDEIGPTIAFTPLDHALEIEGLCASCS